MIHNDEKTLIENKIITLRTYNSVWPRNSWTRETRELYRELTSHELLKSTREFPRLPRVQFLGQK